MDNFFPLLQKQIKSDGIEMVELNNDVKGCHNNVTYYGLDYLWEVRFSILCSTQSS